MNVQYISDSKGVTTGVFIPINDWNVIKDKYAGIEDDTHIPLWHQQLVTERMENFSKDPGQALDFESALDDIDNSL